MNSKNQYGILQPADLEQIERFIYKSDDDIAISIARSFERLEEKLDAIESRLFLQMEEIEKQLDTELLAVRSLIRNRSEELAA